MDIKKTLNIPWKTFGALSTVLTFAQYMPSLEMKLDDDIAVVKEGYSELEPAEKLSLTLYFVKETGYALYQEVIGFTEEKIDEYDL